jgi:hypothetical protein
MAKLDSKNDNKEEIIPSRVEQYLLDENRRINSLAEWISFSKARRSLYDAAIKSNLPFDPKFNSVHWALDVVGLIEEILFSYCWMNACALYYKEKVKEGTKPGHVYFPLSYFADNCITRIYSCRDKIALMVWAFYIPFNPEKPVLDYNKLVKHLKDPKKYGYKIKNHKYFLKYLETLNGKDFKRIEQYRHIKIHRREPRVEIYGLKSHHGWPYLIPIKDQRRLKIFDKKLAKDYPDPQQREIIKNSCHVNGVLFDQRRVKDHLWDFDKVQKHIKTCLTKLLKASDGCFRILRRRAPLKRTSK